VGLLVPKAGHQRHRLLARPQQRYPPHVAAALAPGRAHPPPLLDEGPTRCVGPGLRRPARVRREAVAGRPADHEVVALLGAPPRLVEVAELAVGHPPPRARPPPPGPPP